jgi:predicted 3-demethylubiquinone-9 3-methyltransferase (glyoxalase superfamily)
MYAKMVQEDAATMQKIMPCLWFDTQTEDAMTLYSAGFPDSRINLIKRYPDGIEDGPMAGMGGKVLTAIFELAGQPFMALDGGPTFRFTPATSLFVNCATADEVDHLWGKLSDGAAVLMPLQSYPFSEKFGWLADQFGLSWQINLGSRAQKITPFLMFVGEQHGKAEEAIHFYTSLFRNSRIESIQRYGAGEEGGAEGTVKHAVFQLDGCEFMAIDSSHPHDFSFNEAFSFYVECQTQDEVDHLWNNLSAHPDAEQCGWLKDKFGVSWQIIPTALGELMNDPDPEKSGRVMQAILQMKKIDIAGLQRAHAG